MLKFKGVYINVTDFVRAMEFYRPLFGEPGYIEENSWASWFNGKLSINNDADDISRSDNVVPELNVESLYELKGLQSHFKKIYPGNVSEISQGKTPGYFHIYFQITDPEGNCIDIAYSEK